MRLRLRVPTSPHFSAEQSVHGIQSETSQSTGHGGPSQGLDSASAGHAAPPWAGSVVTARLRVRVPTSPHFSAEQSVHGSQSETSQSTGHGGPSHGFDSASAGHAFPPWAGSVVTARVRVRVPTSPHFLAEQSVHGSQSETSQSTGSNTRKEDTNAVVAITAVATSAINAIVRASMDEPRFFFWPKKERAHLQSYRGIAGAGSTVTVIASTSMPPERPFIVEDAQSGIIRKDCLFLEYERNEMRDRRT